MATRYFHVNGAECLKGMCPEMHSTVKDGEVAPQPVDLVNHPPHYKDGGPVHSECGKPIECIDVVELMNFNTGNTVKYIWRAGKKGGDAKLLEDMKKARWYLDREISRLEDERDAARD